MEQWRFLTGDQRADDLLKTYGSAYGRFRVSGDERHLVAGLQQLLEGVRYNTPLQTSSALYTDRIYVPGWELLKAMLTGDGMHNNSSPYHWVSWEKTNDDFTALVCDSGRDLLANQNILRMHSAIAKSSCDYGHSFRASTASATRTRVAWSQTRRLKFVKLANEFPWPCPVVD